MIGSGFSPFAIDLFSLAGRVRADASHNKTNGLSHVSAENSPEPKKGGERPDLNDKEIFLMGFYFGY